MLTHSPQFRIAHLILQEASGWSDTRRHAPACCTVALEAAERRAKRRLRVRVRPAVGRRMWAVVRALDYGARP